MMRFFRASVILAAILFVAAGVTLGLIYLHNYYSVKQIRIAADSPNNGPIVGLDDLNGDSMITLSEKQVITDLQKRNPGLQSITVSREFPSTLKIRVTHRTPLVALQVSDDGVFILDREGSILNRQQKYTGTLPILKYYQTFAYKQFQVGEKIDFKDIVQTLYFVDSLNGFGYQAKRIDIEGLYMIRLLVFGEKSFFFTSEKDEEVQMYQLKELLRQFKIQGKDFKTVDLRFDKPVITIK